MFGQKSAFGSTPGASGFGGTGTTFGATGAPTSTFGSTGTTFAPAGANQAFGTTSAFGAPAQPGAVAAGGGGGLFSGTQPQTSVAGGLFSQPAASTSFGTSTTGFGAAAVGGASAFGASAFAKPGTYTGTGFGAPAATSAGGLFGAPTVTSSAAGLFGTAQQTPTFGAAGSAFGAPAGGAFGGQAAPVGTTVKFNPPTGSDTMMKSGVTTNINTRHQCITCMKEYESKSLEELRCEDYLANRKGGGATAGTAAAAAAAGGLFGAPPNQTAPGAGGFFGSTAVSTQSTMFGQQNKPLFGSTAAGFGGTSTAPSFGGGASTFGTTGTSVGAGGLFGNKPAFGTPATTGAGAFGFGQQQTTATTGLFGQQQQQQQQNKPLFGAATAGTSQAGGLFGSTTNTGFGAQTTQPAFGATGATPGFGGFGQTQQQPGTIGLFGQQQQQAKPGAFAGFGTTATSTAAPAFGGTSTGFGAPAAQTNMFGGQNKPGFGGFGSTATSAPSFGAFGASTTQTQPGGIFGAQKPGLTFGAATTQAAPAFGGFGATNTAAGGLFAGTAATQNKPTSLFGTTGTFGAPGSTFGAGTGTFAGGFTGGAATGGGGLFGGTGGAAQLQPQQLQTTNNPIQQQLVQLASSPYGDNPLFKNLADPGKREDILKPINPVAQKALDSTQFKISPHRNVKARAKPIGSLAGNKSAIFEGLEDDDINPKSDLFVPRSSVKKLVLKLSLKSPTAGSPVQGEDEDGASPTSLQQQHQSSHDQSHDHSHNRSAADESLGLPAVKDLGNKAASSSNVSIVDESFAALNPQRNKGGKDDSRGHKQPSAAGGVGGDAAVSGTSVSSPGGPGGSSGGGAATADTSVAGSEELELDDGIGPADVVLRRAGYYTIPALADLSMYVDESTGSCLVENFTVGRNGYGNVFFPGVTNVAGLNLDEIVFIRHKEVIVYPDDNKKPPLGEGLNKKAQITLDKVWPVDKTNKANIKSPEKLAELNYEDKLQRACIKLGARFVEYRPETGSWVFKVDHFSKYGLDDSDEDDAGKKSEANKKLKTLQLREPSKQQQLQQPEKPKLVAARKPGEKTDTATTMTTATVHAEDVPSSRIDSEEEMQDVGSCGRTAVEPMEGQQDMSPPLQQLTRLNAPRNKVQLMKASLFDDNDDDTMMVVEKDAGGRKKEEAVAPKARPVILQARPVLLEKRPPTAVRDSLIEDIAHSMLTGSSTGKGLGGSFSLEHAAPTLTSSLLRTRFFPHVVGRGGGVFDASRGSTFLAGEGPSSFLKQHSSFATAGDSSALGGQVPSYSLHSAYEKFVVLPTPGPGERPKAVVPRCLGRAPPPGKSLFTGRLKCVADSGLSSGRRFRAGWAGDWTVANPGRPSHRFAGQGRFGSVSLERVKISSGDDDDSEQQLRLLESWLELSLEYSSVEFDDLAAGERDEADDQEAEDAPPAVPRIVPDAGLDALHAHAAEASKQVADAANAGGSGGFARNLRESKHVWDLCLALWGKLEEQDIFGHGPDSHEVTMLRREALSTWLAEVVTPAAERDLRRAALRGDAVGEVLALLSANRHSEACARAQENGDHYAAMLAAIGGGSNSEKGQLLLMQMERWQEARADEFIAADRLRLYATLAGVPTWPGSRAEEVNVCAGLDWKRALGQQLWHLTSPVASVGDAFLGYEESFQGEQVYAAPPKPDYLEEEEDRGGEGRKGTDTDKYDVKYHLLKLYTNRSHPMEVVLDPETHTPDPLDFRLSWFLYRVLLSLGYVHATSRGQDALHSSFAAQLESLGLWHWAVFVLLHCEDAFLRRRRVAEVLSRRVRLRDEDCADREEFLRDHLHVPAAWVAEAKAARARAEGNARDLAFYLIRAGAWKEAHSVVVRQVAPDAVVNDDHDFLCALLTDLSGPAERAGGRVPDWNLNGRTFLDFLEVDAEVRELLERRRRRRTEREDDEDEEELGYQIERLRPRVTSICCRVSSLPAETAKERLCQSEIAKKVAHLMRALLGLDSSSGMGASTELAQHLSDLPMPDDYALQELRALTRSFMMEKIGGRRA